MSAEPRAPFGRETGAPAAAAAPCLYHLDARRLGGLRGAEAWLDRARRLGFDGVLLSPLFAAGADPFEPASHEAADAAFGEGAGVEATARRLAEAAAARDLTLLLDLPVARFAAAHPWVVERPSAFEAASGAARGLDPRQGEAAAVRPRFDDAASAEALHDALFNLMRSLASAGAGGFRLVGVDAAPPDVWARLLQRLRRWAPRLFILAETQGLARDAALGLRGCGFDAVTSSLPYWDGRAAWLVEEHEALRQVAPPLAVAAPLSPPDRRRGPGEDLAARRALGLAGVVGSGLLVPMGLEDAGASGAEGAPVAFTPEQEPPLAADVRRAVEAARLFSAWSGELRQTTGPGAAATLLARSAGADLRAATSALLAEVNPSLSEPAPPPGAEAYEGLEFAPPDARGPVRLLEPGEARVRQARRREARPAPTAPEVATAVRAARIAIENVSPGVDGGEFAARRIVGERLLVEADVFADGHEVLAVEVQWRYGEKKAWRGQRMSPLGNDRWRAEIVLEHVGRCEVRVEAWLDRFASFQSDLRKKAEAGKDAPVDLDDGEALVRAAAAAGEGDLGRALGDFAAALRDAPGPVRRRLLLAEETLGLMSRADPRPFRTRSRAQPIEVERRQARFASWYELFPRSTSGSTERHGTFADVEARLPAIRAMGFDVLYFPPIHPIGRTNRKGRNNALAAAPGDPGSPYAIGSAEGGHDALHPQLGTFEDFRRLLAAAEREGLEIALDFAVQCSPDHPWLKEHPDWFAWRSDGSIRYAENPPKKYEDIVNVDFYADGAAPALWIALRDVVRFWISQGVRIFRVDNPHTKPLPFWEWMIADVRRETPEVLFLAEAFTRPKMMYRLGKIGFSQSYTYFTWRNAKWEITQYLQELADGPPREFYRPHFFVNTPDINPYFLQTSGRPGHLIRAVLAATLSGLWGVYSGFELLEAEPVPGKEEYLDSEKYELRPRDFAREPNIIPEITLLNRLRRAHPALQTHLDVRFHTAWNDQVLVYSKGRSLEDLILCAVSLDPHAPQETDLELSPAAFGLESLGEAELEDLVTGARFVWLGARQRIRLEPDRPFALFRVAGARP